MKLTCVVTCKSKYTGFVDHDMHLLVLCDRESKFLRVKIIIA